jgi:2-oxoglutarate dehydrogenase complex dehydrogenase (E1) component-like enzyme
MLIKAYMSHGHLMADLDPLKLGEVYKDDPSMNSVYKVPNPKLTSLLDYKTYGLTEEDLEKEFYIDAPELAGLLTKKKNWKLMELIQAY